MSQENVDLIRRAYEQLSRHDPLGDWTWFFAEFAHDDLELWPSEMYLDADEVYRGHEGWARFWREFAAAWDHWRLEVDEIIDAGGDEVVVMARAVGRAKASGLDLEQTEGHLWTIRDGKAAVGRSFTDRADVLRAAGLSA
jgi:ketosteroid isomerase-like protein